MLAVEIRDPREERLEPVGRLSLVDPESGRLLEVDTSRRGLRERFAAAAAQERAGVAAELRKRRRRPRRAVDERRLAQGARAGAAMSFASPLALLCLSAVPLAVLAHVAAQRRRRRYPVRYTALSTLAAVAGAEPQWRRHLPFALFALALAALALSLARPERTVAGRRSSAPRSCSSPTSRARCRRPTSARRAWRPRASAAQSFLDKVPDELRVGLVTFSDAAQTLQTPTTDREVGPSALKTMQPISGTATGAGLRTALDDLKIAALVGAPPAGGARPAVRRIGDRRRRRSTIVATEARRLRVPIYTVALGTPDGTITLRGQTLNVPPDPEALKRIAPLSGGDAFRAEDSDELDAVYERLGSQIGTKPEKREITALFAGGALLLLAGAMVTSLRLGGRLP